MTEYLLRRFGATEVVATLELPDVCAWAECRVTEPLVLMKGDGWCFEHASDDALPRLISAPLKGCAQCGKTTSKRLEDGTQLCPGCRRDWCSKRIAVAKPTGAYARRRKR